MGYSVAYPFGVAGPILLLYFAFLILKPRIDVPAGAGQELLEIAIRNPEVVGKRLGEVMTTLPAGVQIVAVRKDDRNQPAVPEIVLDADDVVLAVGPSKELLEQTRKQLGEAATGRITSDRRDLDYLRVFVSRPALVGRTLGELALPEGIQYLIMHVRRGDADLLARPDLVLEFGDRVGLLTDRASFPAVRKFFGDSIKGTAEFSYISIGLGMALGFLVGAIHVPIPGVGKLAIGLAGVLVVALVLGKLRRTARHELDDPAFRQPGSAEPRPHAVPRAGRHGVRAEVRRHGGRDGIPLPRLRRRHPVRARAADPGSRPVRVPDAVRPGGRDRRRARAATRRSSPTRTSSRQPTGRTSPTR